SILDNIKYRKKHKNTITLNYEISKVADYLKNIGYFLNTFDSLKKINNAFIAHFSLHKKTEKAIIKVASDAVFLFNNIEFKNNSFSLSVHELQATLTSISKKLDTQGKSFSKVQLKNILIKNKNMFADLQIYQSKKRTINNVTIKGYKNFPKSYIKNYFNIKNNTVFNQQKIKEISEGSKILQFITEIKPPEVLFTKDSTSIYIYLKKKQNNSFDGLINFTTKEDGGILFNGNIDLKLNNILNKGEKFSLFWNSIAEERQEFKLSTQIPYIFVSKFSPQLSFSIYKQDSTFINTKFDSKIFYNINPKAKLAITYNSENSEKLKQSINNNIETFSNKFLGLQLQYNLPNKKFFDNNQLYLELEPSIGKRKIRDISSNQYKMEASISFNWNLNRRSSLFIKNKTGYLNSENYIYNELFRIGGANTIRGFNEQSIFTSSYSYFNLEYRFHTATDAFLYSITDFALISTTNHREKLIGLGIGYLFTSKNAQINISTAVGSSPSTPLNFKNTQFFVNWVNFF
ncbi:MAG: outer membrane protein assembly factor BamA, partial [Sediminicola sp.]